MKVSVITIVYNNVDTVASCIESVLNQSYTDIEYIVIDGASTDGTTDIIQSFSHRISVFKSEKDNGLYDALNKGLSCATGDIVGLLHADDLYYTTDVVADVVSRFNETSADLVYGNGVYVSPDDLTKVKRVYRSNNFKKWFLPFGWIPLHTTIYVKRTLLEQYGLYETQYTIAGDYEISLRWFTNDAIKKVFLNNYLVRMRLGGKSTTARLQKRKSQEDLHIIKRYKLPGLLTLGFKIVRKIPQFIVSLHKV